MTNQAVPVNTYAETVGTFSTTSLLTFFSTVAPTAQNTQFQVGQRWVNTSDGTEYILVGFSTASGYVQAIWLPLGVNTPAIETLTGNTGPAVVPTMGNITVVGDGTTLTFDGAGSTLTGTVLGGGFTWQVVVAGSQLIARSHGYFANGGGVVFTLPALASVGDIFRLVAMDAGGWSLAQNAGQQIQFGNVQTTAGVMGSLSSTAVGDSILIVCNVTNTNFMVLSVIGNITYA